jgi:hypothetical protein
MKHMDFLGLRIWPSSVNVYASKNQMAFRKFGATHC